MTSEPDQAKSQTIATIVRATDVLHAFTVAEGDTLGVTELAEMLGLSKAVVHRILSSLRVKEFVEIDAETRRYSLGPSALALGLTYLQRLDVRERARPLLRELSDRTNETSTLSIRHGDQRIYIDQVNPLREVKMTVQLGRSYPLHAGASSKAFLASLPSGDIEAYLSRQLDALTERTITDPKALRVELKRIRAAGYAISLGERQEGAGSAAAPIMDHSGYPVAVISVCGPVERFRGEIDEITPVLLEAARRLSRQFGWDGQPV